jgi:hypothetical protein
MHGELFYESADGQFHTRAFMDVEEKSIRITSYRRITPGHPDKTSQVLKVRYWPTCIRRLSNGLLCVAGKGSRTASTIVEVWKFDPPRVSEGVLKPAEVRSIDEIYNELAFGRDLVEDVLPFWGGPSQAMLVKFNDTKDVYKMTLAGAYTLVASPTAQAGAIHAPLLASAYDSWARELLNGGYVYAFVKPVVSSPQAPSVLFLRDPDKDGDLDSSVELTGAQFTAQGYNLESNWVPH